MNKDELAREIARRSKPTFHPITRDAAEQVIDLLLTAIRDELMQGGSLAIEHFGVFEVKIRRPRGCLKQGQRQAKSGNTLHYHIHFRPSPQFKRLLREELNKPRL